MTVTGPTFIALQVRKFDSPFGRTFTFSDPDGYAITIHDQAGHATSSKGKERP